MSSQYQVTNPWTNKVVHSFEGVGAAGVDVYVKRARHAFKENVGRTAHERAGWLERAATAIEARVEEIAALAVAHIGKPKRAAAMEIRRSAAFVSACAKHLHAMTGEALVLDAVPVGKGHYGFTKHVPYGVVAAVTPFNAPVNLLVQKLAPALATGNSVIVKPCIEGTEIAELIVDLFNRSGVPEGLVSVVRGDREEAAALAAHPGVDVVTLTGGTAAGDALARAAGAKKFIGELGGNSANIVLRDANLDDAIGRLVMSSFEASGQQCISTQRIIVEKDIFDVFVQKFSDAASKLKVGDPNLDDVDVGPVVSRKAATRIRAMIADAEDRGAKIITFGDHKDCLLYPTIVVNPPSAAALIKDEVFGPVVVVISANDVDDAIQIANDCEFGLQASCFTSNLSAAFRMSEELQVGALWVNEASRFRLDNYPFGGVGRSGVGREGLPYALEEYTQLKFIGIRPS